MFARRFYLRRWSQIYFGILLRRKNNRRKNIYFGKTNVAIKELSVRPLEKQRSFPPNVNDQPSNLGLKKTNQARPNYLRR